MNLDAKLDYVKMLNKLWNFYGQRPIDGLSRLFVRCTSVEPWYPLSREEADELCRTLEENEDKSRTASEMADVLYHAMVLLNLRGVEVEEVLQVLRTRFSQSGIEEKKSRKSQG